MPVVSQRLLRELEGKARRAAGRHARFHREDVPYHFVSRVLQGFLLMRPDRRGHLNRIVAGVVGRAQVLFPKVRLYSYAFLSNHFHQIASGPPDQLPAFIGFIKREIARRWSREIGWSGTFWESYESSALPTPESLVACMKYVLLQSVAEGLVADPRQWPGLHCARQLSGGEPARGVWLDATAYGRALHRERRRAHPRPVRRRDFETTYEIVLARLPGYEGLSDADYRAFVCDLIEQGKAEARAARAAKPPLGRRNIFETPRSTKSELPRPPWFEDRRRLICWGRRSDPNVRAYLESYWSFQYAYREASARYLAGDLAAQFPPGAFRPPRFEPGHTIDTRAAA